MMPCLSSFWQSKNFHVQLQTSALGSTVAHLPCTFRWWLWGQVALPRCCPDAASVFSIIEHLTAWKESKYGPVLSDHFFHHFREFTPWNRPGLAGVRIITIEAPPQTSWNGIRKKQFAAIGYHEYHPNQVPTLSLFGRGPEDLTSRGSRPGPPGPPGPRPVATGKHRR